MKALKTIEDVEAYLGSQECNSTETPLSIWNARMLLLLSKRNRSLSMDIQSSGCISDIGQGIVNMAKDPKKQDTLINLVHELEGYVTEISDGKYLFDTRYRPGTYYQLFAKMVIYIESRQDVFYQYLSVHSNLNVEAKDIKSGVKYYMKTKRINQG